MDMKSLFGGMAAGALVATLIVGQWVGYFVHVGRDEYWEKQAVVHGHAEYVVKDGRVTWQWKDHE